MVPRTTPGDLRVHPGRLRVQLIDTGAPRLLIPELPAVGMLPHRTKRRISSTEVKDFLATNPEMLAQAPVASKKSVPVSPTAESESDSFKSLSETFIQGSRALNTQQKSVLSSIEHELESEPLPLAGAFVTPQITRHRISAASVKDFLSANKDNLAGALGYSDRDEAMPARTGADAPTALADAPMALADAPVALADAPMALAGASVLDLADGSVPRSRAITPLIRKPRISAAEVKFFLDANKDRLAEALGYGESAQPGFAGVQAERDRGLAVAPGRRRLTDGKLYADDGISRCSTPDSVVDSPSPMLSRAGSLHEESALSRPGSVRVSRAGSMHESYNSSRSSSYQDGADFSSPGSRDPSAHGGNHFRPSPLRLRASQGDSSSSHRVIGFSVGSAQAYDGSEPHSPNPN